jgi:glutaredoxin
MDKKIFIPGVLFAFVLVFTFIVIYKEGVSKEQGEGVKGEIINKEQGESDIILFYTYTCPHCKIVDEYIEENKIEEKIPFSHKEVSKNKENSKELEEKAEICNIPLDSIGVPFLWDGERCLLGDKDIIEFFKQKTN